MMNIKLATDNRKAAAARLAEIIGAEVHYTRAPRFAYEIGNYTIERDLSVTVDDGAGLQPLQTLVDEGLIESFEEPAAEPEEISLTVEVPMANHTGSSVRNLINLLYTRASLILNVADEYEQYCQKNSVINGVVKQDTLYIRQLYQELSRDHRIG